MLNGALRNRLRGRIKLLRNTLCILKDALSLPLNKKYTEWLVRFSTYRSAAVGQSK
jgi:hypothetical protein